MPNRVCGTYKMFTKCLLKGQTYEYTEGPIYPNLYLPMANVALWDSRPPLSSYIITHSVLLLSI